VLHFIYFFLQRKPTIGVICGAGGTGRAAAFALLKLDLDRVYVWNRTKVRSEELCKQFGSRFAVLDSLVELNSLSRIDIVLCTIPSSEEFSIPEVRLPS
jgi:shikimate 5-dehydrogenase